VSDQNLRDSTLTRADRGLMLLLFRYGQGPDSTVWQRLSADWRRRLEPSWSEVIGDLDANRARDLLADEHRAEARPDPKHIHPSWFIRAAREQSSAAQRIIAQQAAEPIASTIRRALGLNAESLMPHRPPHPEAMAWVLALWTERLVGGPETLPNDPPVVRALSRLDGRGHYGMITTLGLGKLALANVTPARLSHHHRRRFEALRTRLTVDDPNRPDWASRDVEAVGNPNARHVLVWLGLLTVGRLLASVEPHRRRWALQHLPYEAAKPIRVAWLSDNWPAQSEIVLSEERSLFRVVVGLLCQEGHLEALTEPE